MDMIETIKIMLDALENHTAIKHPQQIHYRDRAIEAGRQAVLKGHDMDKPEWQGLKPEEIEKLAKWADEHGHGPFHTDFAFAIDRLLRGKNLRRGEISQEPVAILNHAHGVHVFRNVKLNELPDGEYAVYTHPYTRQPKQKPLTDEQAIDAQRYRLLRRGQYWSVIDGMGDVLRADELDAAIDAAIKLFHGIK